jgi:CRISPR/Cas system-associated protein Csm6
MKKTIITTVGTSILENYNGIEISDCFKTEYKPIGTHLSNIRNAKQNTSSDYNDFDIEIEEVYDIIKDNWFKGIHKIKNEKGEWKWKKEANVLNNNASAEIASILAIAGNETDVRVHLIATDTVLSVLAAELIQKWFNQNKPEITVAFTRPEKLEQQSDSNNVIRNLSISSNDKYQEGFMNLIEVVSKLIDEGKKGKVILNITGGYKAIIPIMTLLGQIKEVPLKYIYEESDLNEKTELVEVGNLPISFDWGIIDALKPFLNVNYSSFWNAENKKLLKAVCDCDIYLDIQSNSFKTKENKEEFKSILQKKDLRIIKHLLDLKLITKDCKVTALGSLFQKVQELDSRRGYQMEYILYNYFARSESKKSKEVNNYSATTLIDLSGSFKFENNQLVTRDEGAKGGWKELGDIDISLENNKTYVLGESKAFSKFLSYREEKNNEKYRKQIHARLQRFTEIHIDKIDKNNPSLEFLMIIFQFQFKGFEEDILENELVKSTISKFKELEKIEIGIGELKFKPQINFLGLKCLIDLNHNKLSANYTYFYQKPCFKWEVLE